MPRTKTLAAARQQLGLPLEFLICRAHHKHLQLVECGVLQGAIDGNGVLNRRWFTRQWYCDVDGVIIRQPVDSSGRAYPLDYDYPPGYLVPGGVPPEILDDVRLDMVRSSLAEAAPVQDLTPERVAAMRSAKAAVEAGATMVPLNNGTPREIRAGA